jgi:hypothetical protein
MYLVLGQSLSELSNYGSEDSEMMPPPVDPTTFLNAFQTVLKGLEIRIVLGRLRVLLPQSEWVSSVKIAHRFIDYYVNKAQRHDHQQDHSPSRDGRENEPSAGERIAAKKEPYRSLLQGLMEQTDDKIEIRNQIIQAMMAAQDTTSVLLSNTLFLLSRHPSIWTRLRSEVLSLGSATQLTLPVLNSLNFVRKVLHECNYPPLLLPCPPLLLFSHWLSTALNCRTRASHHPSPSQPTYLYLTLNEPNHPSVTA